MPITPFHFGPALLVKGVLPRVVSLVAFSITQCVIDVETVSNIMRGNYPFHATAHTVFFGSIIGLSVGAATSLTGRLIGRTGQRGQLLGMQNEFEPIPCLVGGVIGGASHAVLDAMMHADTSPLNPFSSANPFLAFVSVRTLHLLCFVAGVAGVLLIRTVSGESLAKWIYSKARSTF